MDHQEPTIFRSNLLLKALIPIQQHFNQHIVTIIIVIHSKLD